jgi:1,4-dihydroxy-2-naphthoyl-CoA hydrolase
MTFRPERDRAFFEDLSRGHFPEWIGLTLTEVADGLARAELRLRPEHFAPNGFVHAGAIVTLADTAAGYGCVAHLPDDAIGFTTLELKTNFLGAAREGVLRCEARAVHLGRTTQVWDATVTGDALTVAVFRCTQLVLQA